MNGQREVVTYKRWERYARKLERANLDRCGRSLGSVGIASAANHHIEEARPDQKVMIVLGAWQRTMDKAASTNGLGTPEDMPEDGAY